jgi:hypothetical protein
VARLINQVVELGREVQLLKGAGRPGPGAAAHDGRQRDQRGAAGDEQVGRRRWGCVGSRCEQAAVEGRGHSTLWPRTARGAVAAEVRAARDAPDAHAPTRPAAHPDTRVRTRQQGLQERLQQLQECNRQVIGHNIA